MLVYSRSFTWYSWVNIMDSRADTNLAFQFVGSNSSTYLHQEDDAKQEGEGEGHAVVLLDCSTTSKEGNKENDAANDDEKHRS